MKYDFWIFAYNNAVPPTLFVSKKISMNVFCPNTVVDFGNELTYKSSRSFYVINADDDESTIKWIIDVTENESKCAIASIK